MLRKVDLYLVTNVSGQPVFLGLIDPEIWGKWIVPKRR